MGLEDLTIHKEFQTRNGYLNCRQELYTVIFPSLALPLALVPPDGIVDLLDDMSPDEGVDLMYDLVS